MAQQLADFKVKVDQSIKGDSKVNEKQDVEEKDKKEYQQDQLVQKLTSTEQNHIVNPEAQKSQKSGLFGIELPTSGLFAKCESQSGHDQQPIDLTKPGPSLFGISYDIPKQEESESEASEDEGEKNEENDEPEEIVMKFDYTPTTEVIVQIQIEKFRRNNCDLLEKGSVAIEKQKTNGSIYFIYRNQIQQILYIGQLASKISEIKRLGQKEENILLKAVSYNEKYQSKEEKQEQKELSLDTLKIMFENKDGSELFKEKLNNLLNEIK